MGGAREIVTSSCGRLVAPDPDAVAEALRELIVDSSLRTALGRSAAARAAELCDPRATMHIIGQTLAAVVERASSKLPTVHRSVAVHLETR